MANVMRVHLFQVHNSVSPRRLEEVLELVAQAQLDDRLRAVGMNEMRLEEALRPRSVGNAQSVWLLDFTKLRFDNGPGKVSRTEPIEGFDLDDDEGFGEETAALYDPSTRHILIQYNHHGPRAGSVAAYLSTFDPNQTEAFDFQLRMDAQAEQRLARKQVIKKLHFKVAPPKMTAAMRHAGVTVERALELSENLGGQTVEVVISAGRGHLSQGRIQQVIEGLKRLRGPAAGHDGGAIETFRVHARADLDEETEVIDLLSPKLEQEIDGLVMGEDRRYTRRSRWDALLRAHNGWSGVLRP